MRFTLREKWHFTIIYHLLVIKRGIIQPSNLYFGSWYDSWKLPIAIGHGTTVLHSHCAICKQFNKNPANQQFSQELEIPQARNVFVCCVECQLVL